MIDMAPDAIIQRTIQVTLRLLAVMAPSAAASLTWRLFCTPFVASQPTPSQQQTLAQAKAFSVAFGRHSLNCYRWGSGPTLLAVHGWGGRAHVFGDLIPDLVNAGYSVVSFDAPGHYRLGQKTNMLEYSSAVRAVCRDIGPVVGLMGHSFGAFTSAYSAGYLPDLKALALIGAPDRLHYILDYAGQLMFAPRSVMQKVEKRIEKLSGEPVERHATRHYLERNELPKLVIHDTDDREIPVEHARAMATSLNADFLETSGYGHHRILHSPDVGRRLTDFFDRHIA